MCFVASAKDAVDYAEVVCDATGADYAGAGGDHDGIGVTFIGTEDAGKH